MSWRGLPQLMVVDLKLFLREPVAAFFTLAFPLLLLLVFGAIYGNAPQEILGGFGTVDVSVPSYMAIIIASTGLLTMSITIATYRERGILRRFRVTPVTVIAVLASQTVVNFFVTVVGAAILVTAGRIIYDLRFAGDAAVVAAGFALSALSFLGVGFLVSSVTRTGRVAQAVGLALFYPMIFLSGASIPLQVMPTGLQELARIFPLYYVVKVLQGAWTGKALEDLFAPALLLAAILIGSVGLSIRLFRWER